LWLKVRGEVRSQLYIALDAGYLDNDTFQKLHGMAHELGKISGLALAVRTSATPARRKTDKPPLPSSLLRVTWVTVRLDNPFAGV
jgi:hypothetical protein